MLLKKELDEICCRCLRQGQCINIHSNFAKKDHSCYKEYVNLYTQVIKSLMTFIGKGEEETSSPLRDYFKKVQGLND